jgi:hypothetical protein
MTARALSDVRPVPRPRTLAQAGAYPLNGQWRVNCIKYDPACTATNEGVAHMPMCVADVYFPECE